MMEFLVILPFLIAQFLIMRLYCFYDFKDTLHQKIKK